LEKKPKEYALEYAGFWVRLGAGIIDLLILVLVYGTIFKFVVLVPGWFSGMAVFGSLSADFTLFRQFISGPLIWVIAGAIKIAYFVGFWAWRGQTPGKMICGIKVIRTDSSPVTLGRAFLRYLGYIVSAMTLYIGSIWIAFDSHKQGLNDKIADTYVVKLPVRQVVLTQTYASARTGAGIA
jgi:uncharacterized RDD family membrane protein YckC